jgi:hypothetical protein
MLYLKTGMHKTMQSFTTENSMEPTSLEPLRVLSEATACLRSRPRNVAAWRRWDESIRWSAESHGLQAVADAAGISVNAVESALRQQGRPRALAFAARNRVPRRPQVARFRPVRSK